jgi:hypothetical protein
VEAPFVGPVTACRSIWCHFSRRGPINSMCVCAGAGERERSCGGAAPRERERLFKSNGNSIRHASNQPGSHLARTPTQKWIFLMCASEFHLASPRCVVRVRLITLSAQLRNARRLTHGISIKPAAASQCNLGHVFDAFFPLGVYNEEICICSAARESLFLERQGVRGRKCFSCRRN